MKNKLKDLVAISYKNGELDEKTVEAIADKLSRKELKEYIRLLKHEEDNKQVYVTSAKELTEGSRKMIQNRFPEKKILYSVDPTMISGIRIIEKDNEYEISLNQTFSDIIGHITKYE